ncbi:MAG: DUF2497 domain-containing protein [Rickettsiaceae bacterium]|nr:DUF2497 domain-containing protein [Rickettsiaceae bacterium]
MKILDNFVHQGNSQASSILDKVTKALDAKKHPQSLEDDVLELTEAISNDEKMIDTISDSIEEAGIVSDEYNISNVIKMKEKMVSEATAEKTSALFNQLKSTVKTKIESESLKFRAGTTMEDVVSELIRPHLIEWLNQNLHSIVRNCVEKEVQKLLPSEE